MRRHRLREKSRTAHLATHAKHRRLASRAQLRARRRRTGRRRRRCVRRRVARFRKRLGGRVPEQGPGRRRRRVRARAERNAGLDGISARENTRPRVVVVVAAEPARVARTLGRRGIRRRHHRRRRDGGVLVARRRRRRRRRLRLSFDVRPVAFPVGGVSVRHRASSLAAATESREMFVRHRRRLGDGRLGGGGGGGELSLRQGFPSPPERPALFVANVRRLHDRTPASQDGSIGGGRAEVRPPSVAAGVAAGVAARRGAIAPVAPTLRRAVRHSVRHDVRHPALSFQRNLEPLGRDVVLVRGVSGRPLVPLFLRRLRRRLRRRFLLRLATRRRKRRRRRRQHRHGTVANRPPPRGGRDGHLVRVFAPAGGGGRVRQRRQTSVSHGVSEKRLEKRRAGGVVARRVIGAKRAQTFRPEPQRLSNALGVALRHGSTEVVGRQQRVDDVEVLCGHGARAPRALLIDAAHDGIVPVLVEHAPQKLGGEQQTRGGVGGKGTHAVELVQRHGAVDGHRVRVPVELGEEGEKLVQNLQRRRQLLVEGVEHVQHQRLQRVGGDERVVRAQDSGLVESPGFDEDDGSLEDAPATDERVHLLQKTERGETAKLIRRYVDNNAVGDALHQLHLGVDHVDLAHRELVGFRVEFLRGGGGRRLGAFDVRAESRCPVILGEQLVRAEKADVDVAVGEIRAQRHGPESGDLREMIGEEGEEVVSAMRRVGAGSTRWSGRASSAAAAR